MAAAVVALALVGGATGCVCGAVAGAVAGLAAGGGAWAMAAFLGAVLGTPLGAVLGPLLGLGPLRRVPLGLAIAGPALAATVTGVLSFVVIGVFAPLAGAVAAIVAAALLWDSEAAQRR